MSRLLCLLAFAASAHAASLANYGLTVLNNLNAHFGAYRTSVAVGGNATLTSINIGADASSSATNLIVAGNLTAQGGSVNGTTLVGGTLSSSGGWTSTALAPPGTPLPLDFAAEATRLTALSSLIAATPVSATDTAVVAFSTLTLTANGPGAHVFHVTQATLDSVTTVRITAPANATVIIDIPGTSNSFSFKGLSLSGGINETHVLYNWASSTSLTMTGIGLLGSILAPHADYQTGSGVVLGQVVVRDFSAPFSSMDINSGVLFSGDLPSASTVPEPSSLALVALGAAALLLRRRA